MYNNARTHLSQIAAATSHIANNSGSSGLTGFTPIQFTVGDSGGLTPLDGTAQYLNSLMAGSTAANTVVFVNGEGVLRPTIDFNYHIGGGIDLLSGRLFSTGNVYTILIVN